MAKKKEPTPESEVEAEIAVEDATDAGLDAVIESAKSLARTRGADQAVEYGGKAFIVTEAGEIIL